MTPERWKQVEALYNAAHTLPPGERAAFLAGSCPDDEDLRREVESLLNEPAEEEGFLEPAIATAEATAPDVPMTGRSLGAYHLQALIGAGGMGEVYRARDTTLARDVAIKILPREFTSDPGRLARLAREARMLAAVNHPGICAIYGFEEAGLSSDTGQAAVRFLVLEFVEGETLAARLGRVSKRQSRQAGLPLDQALGIARQIADALEAAHDKGIVHRDLKPANITLTPTGVVKVLDFGLAKAVGVSDAGATSPGETREGMLVGTAAYMSPEQARGLFVDKRTDVWAFGCVLYEMLTGRVAFGGDTVSDSIAKILEREPDWTALPVDTPASIRRLLHRCLVKDPRKRLRDIGDVRIEIDDVGDGASTPPETAVRSSTGRTRAAWAPWLVAAVLAAALAGVTVLYLLPLPSPAVVRFTQSVSPGQPLNASRGSAIVAISPDGKLLVYSGFPRGLYLRSLDTLEVKLIPGTEAIEATGPVFSPDSSRIAFFTFSDRTLKVIDVRGGAAQELCMAKPPTGMTWGLEGIVFGQGQNIGQGQNADAVKSVTTDGTGTVRVLVHVEDGEWAHGPQMLPGGDQVLYTLARGIASDRWDRAQVLVKSLTPPESPPRVVIKEGSDARYIAATGHIIYAVSGNLYAVTFDPRTLKTGDPVTVLNGVRRASGNATGAAAFGVSDTGTLVYVPGPTEAPGSAPTDLAIMTREGVVTALRIDTPGLYAHPAVSPDDTRVAFDTEGGKNEGTIYTYLLDGGSLIQPLATEGKNRFPVWASKTRVAFQSDRDGTNAVWWQALDGSPAEPLTTPKPGESHAPESWFDETLLYSVTKGPEVTLWTLTRGDKTARRFGEITSSAPLNASFSPDGRRVAYTTTNQAEMTLFVQQFPTGGTHPLRGSGADTPKQLRWWRDGKGACYNPNTLDFVCATIDINESVTFGKPSSVPKKLALTPPGQRTNYDLMRDGRFVGFITYGQDQFVRGSDSEIQVVLNWFEELKSRAPRR